MLQIKISDPYITFARYPKFDFISSDRPRYADIQLSTKEGSYIVRISVNLSTMLNAPGHNQVYNGTATIEATQICDKWTSEEVQFGTYENETYFFYYAKLPSGLLWTINLITNCPDFKPEMGIFDTSRMNPGTLIDMKPPTGWVYNDIRIKDLIRRVTDLERRMTEAENRITALEKRMDTAESNISSLQTSVSSHGTSIGSINSSITSINSRLSSIERRLTNGGL